MGNSENKPCVFCNLRQEKVHTLKEDEEFFAFHDINKASAQQHVLVCTKEHIKNAYELKSVEDMQKMKIFGQKVLSQLCNKKGIGVNERRFRFGFHLPPYNSVHHVHLHCFVEPLTSCWYDKFHFGCMLHNIEDTAERWKKKFAEEGVELNKSNAYSRI